MSNYDYPSLDLLNDDDEDVYLKSLNLNTATQINIQQISRKN